MPFSYVPFRAPQLSQTMKYTSVGRGSMFSSSMRKRWFLQTEHSNHFGGVSVIHYLSERAIQNFTVDG